MLIDIYLKVYEHSLNGFQVIEQTSFCDGQSSKENNSKSINAKVMVLAHCTTLILIDIYTKFREDSWNDFQVIERTRFCDGQSSKENNSKTINARVMFLAPWTSSNAG